MCGWLPPDLPETRARAIQAGLAAAASPTHLMGGCRADPAFGWCHRAFSEHLSGWQGFGRGDQGKALCLFSAALTVLGS